MRVDRLAYLSVLVSLASIAALACSSSSNDSAPNGSDAGAADSASSTSAHDSSAPTAADAAEGGPTAGDCDAYCIAIMSSCYATGSGYPNNASCMAHCKALPAGMVGDTNDTVGCRQAHALAAATSPYTECKFAGPYPPNGCGDRCDAFCKMATAACGDQWQGKCAETCATWSYDADAGSRLEVSGNTLNCRQFNAELAFEYGDADIDDAGGGCASVGTASAQCK